MTVLEVYNDYVIGKQIPEGSPGRLNRIGRMINDEFRKKYARPEYKSIVSQMALRLQQEEDKWIIVFDYPNECITMMIEQISRYFRIGEERAKAGSTSEETIRKDKRKRKRIYISRSKKGI